MKHRPGPVSILLLFAVAAECGLTGAGARPPAPAPYACNDAQFLSDQRALSSGGLTGDQFVDVCGKVTEVAPERTTRSGPHGYFLLQLPGRATIEIVAGLSEMSAPDWPWVAVGDYVYVQGRYYYDNQSSQGIDWTHRGTGSAWPYEGYVVVCNSAGAACVEYH